MYTIKRNADITHYTTFGTRAECGCFIEYDTASDLGRLAAEHPGILSGDIFCLGGGSNVLFTTGRFSGTVLHCTGDSITSGEGDGSVVAGAGVVLDRLVAHTASLGLWGLENLAAIPGMVGGAAVQNVGAYGAEFAQVVSLVRGFDLDTLREVEYSAEMCRYGYRDSVFKGASAPRVAITEVELRLSSVAAPRLDYAGVRDAVKHIPAADLTPADVAAAVRGIRAGKLPDPAVTGSAGSYFKNPVVDAALLPGIERCWASYCEIEGLDCLPIQHHPDGDGRVKLSAAWLIDKAGCKPLARGGASLWPSQPLVIVNTAGTATAADVLALQRAVQSRVEDAFGVLLTPEVVRVPRS